MKAADVIKQLKLIVPKYTDLFSDVISVESLSFAGGIVTCITSEPHNLQDGNIIFIREALTPITINSLTRDGNIATAVTNSNHDYTDNYTESVFLIGADQPEYNGTHKFIHQPNRRTFQFEVIGDPVTPATGTNIYVLDNLVYGYNGQHTVTVIDDYTFTYPITSEPESPAQGNITIQSNLRISGSVTIDRIIENYTKQLPNKLWMWVVLDDKTTSKDRFTLSDAQYTNNTGQDYRQLTIEPFSVYVAVPSSDDLAVMDIRDSMEDLEQVILKALLNFKFKSPYSDQTNFGCSFARSSMFVYAYSYYFHRFEFETVYYLTWRDGVDEDASVAFRDLNFDFLNKFNQNIVQTDVDLDDEPLP